MRFFSEILLNLLNQILQSLLQNLADFLANCQFNHCQFLTKYQDCRAVHCVDLGESFQTHIYLKILASIQPRTSPVKFAASRDARAESGAS